MSPDQLAFFILSFMVIASGLMFLVSKNIIHAVLYFLLALLATAGIFLQLKAPFLAATQILVYAGAITVLILFVVMLTISKDPEVKVFGQTGIVGPAIAAVSFFAIMAAVVSRSTFTPLPAETAGIDQVQTVAQLGMELYVEYLLPFEIAAFLLLIALVAAVYIALGRGHDAT